MAPLPSLCPSPTFFFSFAFFGCSRGFLLIVQKLTAAMYMGWVNTIALVVLGVTSISRYYCNRKKAGYSVSADDVTSSHGAGGEGNDHIFSETDEDDAQLISNN